MPTVGSNFPSAVPISDEVHPNFSRILKSWSANKFGKMGTPSTVVNAPSEDTLPILVGNHQFCNEGWVWAILCFSSNITVQYSHDSLPDLIPDSYTVLHFHRPSVCPDLMRGLPGCRGGICSVHIKAAGRMLLEGIVCQRECSQGQGLYFSNWPPTSWQKSWHDTTGPSPPAICNEIPTKYLLVGQGWVEVTW